jgi:hypothetical protein
MRAVESLAASAKHAARSNRQGRTRTIFLECDDRFGPPEWGVTEVAGDGGCELCPPTLRYADALRAVIVRLQQLHANGDRPDVCILVGERRGEQ